MQKVNEVLLTAKTLRGNDYLVKNYLRLCAFVVNVFLKLHN